MNQKAIELLEFPEIRAQLASFCGFSASKELAQALEPTADGVLVARRLALTSEAVRVLNLSPNLSVGGARDVRPSVERARLGGLLDAEALLAIRATAASARVMRATIGRLDQLAPGLVDLADRLDEFPSIENEVGRCLGDTGDVLDSASPALGRIRADARNAHQRLLDRLHDLVYGGAYRTALQESLITMREGRYVVPVRSDSRGQLRGLIHDQSSSGQTVYVEPFETVDLNNRWRQLQIEEAHEIERIMRVLSDLVAASADSLIATVTAMAEIDLQLAKARLATAHRAVEPLLELGSGQAGQRGLHLVNARHPLLRGKVVPITVRLGDDFQVMVITGPNTGGKTVALKTAGLLSLMAQAGLHLPADSGSQVHLFQDVMADIGDEQSIEQSLSTFSSHMRNVVEVVRVSGRNTLVLLDEVGAGTDPAEGSALARAVLRRLLDRGAWVIATTHYTELKAFAHDIDGLINASVEFDPQTLAPTYRLQIGLPGKSNALAIAARLGLDADVLADAGQMIDAGQVQVENLLEGIHAERRRAEELLATLDAERKAVQRVRAELDQRLRGIDDERREVLRQARQEADSELAELRAQLRQAATLLQRQERTRGELTTAAQALETAGRQVLAKPLRGTPTLPDLPTIQRASVTRPLAVGDWVRVLRLGRDGQVTGLAADGGAVEVQAGNFKLRVALHEVERTEARQPAEVATSSASSGASIWNLEARTMPERQIDMRGWRAEQVVPELEQYLSDACMAGLPSVRIVHGKGTGVLRQVVREYLAESSMVERFEPADLRDGGEGVTIAHLAG
ncbi:MAG TPA: endonuclease MutS2 [Chloroflexota bacterium]|nr:endonuclease MutS2 [Chloroflexota bacterium]